MYKKASSSVSCLYKEDNSEQPSVDRQHSVAMESDAGAGAAAAAATMQEQQQPSMKQDRKKMKVMVAIDDSDESFMALNWALDNLYGVTGLDEEGGMFAVVHVQEPVQPYFFAAGPGPGAFYPTPAAVESVRNAKKEIAAAILSRALQMCKDKMVKAEIMIVEGDPKDMICELAEKMQVDLLVVGSRGLGKIKRAILGSVSDYCAHHAACPIVIVKPPKEHNK